MDRDTEFNNTMPKAQDAQGRRGRLLDAAILEFSQRGMAGARMDSIAKAAGANKQLLYHYFGDKAQLQREVILALLGRRDAEEALYPTPDGLGEFIELHCRRRLTTPLGRLWSRMLAWEALEHGAESVIGFEQRRGKFDRQVIARIRESQAAGEMDEVFDPEMLALALLAIELIPSVLPNITHTVTGFNGDEEEFAERLIATINQLISRLAPAAAPGSDALDSDDGRTGRR